MSWALKGAQDQTGDRGQAPDNRELGFPAEEAGADGLFGLGAGRLKCSRKRRLGSEKLGFSGSVFQVSRKS